MSSVSRTQDWIHWPSDNRTLRISCLDNYYVTRAERMTHVMFETFNVPPMFVVVQSVLSEPLIGCMHPAMSLALSWILAMASCAQCPSMRVVLSFTPFCDWILPNATWLRNNQLHVIAMRCEPKSRPCRKWLLMVSSIVQNDLVQDAQNFMRCLFTFDSEKRINVFVLCEIVIIVLVWHTCFDVPGTPSVV